MADTTPTDGKRGALSIDDPGNYETQDMTPKRATAKTVHGGKATDISPSDILNEGNSLFRGQDQ